MKRPVKLFMAYYWDCVCGQRNYAEQPPVEITPEERREIEDREGIDLSDMPPGELVSMPEFVECSKCGEEYEAFDPREQNDF